VTPLGDMRDERRPLVFISDLHLNEAMPRTCAVFEAFLTRMARRAGALFILGDLFEYWIGDAMLDTPFPARVAEALHALAGSGTKLFIMHGNRDFLLGPRFMAASGATWLPDPFVVEAFGERVVLAHGDALCTADLGYQYFRRFARQPLAQRFFLGWPLAWRLRLAQGMRARSHAGARVPWPSLPPRYDVTDEAVAKLLRGTRSGILLHGHTHRPAQHRHDSYTRWVLPDWDVDAAAAQARGGYLQLDSQGLRFCALDAACAALR
jgi:UDP-2,3-diacylglucosamine hydrolase